MTASTYRRPREDRFHHAGTLRDRRAVHSDSAGLEMEGWIALSVVLVGLVWAMGPGLVRTEGKG